MGPLRVGQHTPDTGVNESVGAFSSPLSECIVQPLHVGGHVPRTCREMMIEHLQENNAKTCGYGAAAFHTLADFRSEQDFVTCTASAS